MKTKIFTRRQQKFMERVQNEHMPDGCRIHSLNTDYQDELGQPIQRYDISAVLQCGFRSRLSMERFVDSGEGQKFFYELRVPNGTKIKKTDLVEMIHRAGVEVPTKIMFEVSGDPRQGRTAIVAGLKEHTP